MKRKTIRLKCGTIVYLTKYDTETVGADVSLVDERLHDYSAATEADALEGLATHLKTIGANLEGIAAAIRREERERIERYKAMSPITIKEHK